MAAINAALERNFAGNLYDRAYYRGLRARVWALIRHRSSRLLSLNELAAGWTIRSRHFAGRQNVPLHHIRGSENRTDDFDMAFHPLNNRGEDRWRGVAQVWMSGIELPPVELIRVGEIYFVRDGHHRISVAAALGVQAIDALVTEWIVDTAPVVAPAVESGVASITTGYAAGYGERLASV